MIRVGMGKNNILQGQLRFLDCLNDRLGCATIAAIDQGAEVILQHNVTIDWKNRCSQL
jgi:hypothetical protein